MEVLILVCGLWVMILFLTILGMSLSDYFRGEGADESDETNDILDDLWRRTFRSWPNGKA